MAAARAAGGLHTLRHIEAGLQAQLSDHRADLQSYVEESARGSEESALRRAEALLGPPVESIKERLDREVPALERALQANSSEARQELRALRAELAAEASHVRGELAKLGEQLPALFERLRDDEARLASFESVHRDLWTASEAVKANIAQASASLKADMYTIAEEAARTVEKRWCTPFSEKVAGVEASVHELDLRAKHDSAVAMDAAKMVQETLSCRVEELRLHASQEAQRRAAETAAGLRDEILEGELLQRFNERLHQSVICMESRLSDFRAQLADRVEDAAAKTLLSAESYEARLSQVAAQVSEAVECTRRELANQGKAHSEALQECKTGLKELRANVDAADALSRQALEHLRGRVGHLTDDAAELREGLGQARRTAHDDTSALRTELRERTVQWRTFEEVGMPTLLAHVEQRAGEAEGRSVRAALDYAERLRRLPPPAPAAVQASAALAPPTPPAQGREAHTAYTPRPADAGDAVLVAAAVSPPLPPLTPLGGRRPRGY